MADRETITRILSKAYAARVRGDVDGVLRHFADNAVFAVAGSSAASPVPVCCGDRQEMRSVMGMLNTAFVFSDHEVLSLVIDGSQAAAHTRIRVKSAQTGEEAVTETADLITFEGDKVVRYIQFCDTALASKLVGA